ncbi:MAG: DUF2782 domain-containing protein [Rhodanobacter sp.]|jgi:hypothetical protein|nr:DUF2782 domain-containing protein [Rhodanobacter sp.]
MSLMFRVSFVAVLFAAGIGCAVLAANAADRTRPKADLPRPPGINDPGTTPNAATQGADANATEADDPLAPPPKPDARLVRDKASRDAAAAQQRMAASDVTTRKQGDDIVQEYRQNGHVWMVKYIPHNGPMQTFLDTDGSGRLTRNPREGSAAPVYYTLYDWK